MGCGMFWKTGYNGEKRTPWVDWVVVLVVRNKVKDVGRTVFQFASSVVRQQSVRVRLSRDIPLRGIVVKSRIVGEDCLINDNFVAHVNAAAPGFR